MGVIDLARRAVGKAPVNHVPAEIPRAGMVTAVVLSMLTISVLMICFTRRLQATSDWGKVPLTRLLVLLIYGDSILFIFMTSILEFGFGLNSNMTVCGTAILLCLACYLSTKLIYYFLVEKVYIIRSVAKPRLKSRLYLFNCFGMLLPYTVVVCLNFVFRTAYFDDTGMCIIGMEMRSMMPLIIFDAVVNLYLTLLFVLPLRRLYSYKQSTNSALRTITIRSFVGSLATLSSSVVNLTILMVLKGEAAWICLMCCNADVLFSVIVLHWVTSKDSMSSGSSASKNASGVAGSASRRGTKVGNTSLVSSSNNTDNFVRFGGFNDGLGSGNVTTHISANEVAKGRRGVTVVERELKGGDEAEKGAIGRSRKGSNMLGGQSYPLDRMQIQVGRSVEVQSGPRDGVSTLILDGGDDGTEIHRGLSQSSMEELVVQRSRD